MRPCPRDRLGDLGGAGPASDHRLIRYPHQHLKARGYDVEMRRPVIIGIDAHTHSAKALQGRHPRASFSATIALSSQMSSRRQRRGRAQPWQSHIPLEVPHMELCGVRAKTAPSRSATGFSAMARLFKHPVQCGYATSNPALEIKRLKRLSRSYRPARVAHRACAASAGRRR
jgi:hypothetical protein